MSLTHHTRLRRSLAVVSAAAVLVTGLSITPASAEEASDLGESIAKNGDSNRAKQAPAKRAPDEQPQGKQAQGRTPSSSSTDYSQGAVSRSVRIADVSASTEQVVHQVTAVQNLATQRLTATITLKPSAPDRLVIAYFGEFSGSSCIAGAGIAGMVSSAGASGLLLPSEQGFSVARSRAGSVLTLTSQVRPAFRTAEYDCAYVVVVNPANSAQVQNFYAEELVTRWTPKLSIDGGEPVKGAQRGKWVNVRLKVENSGRGVAANTRITASGAGLKISPRSRNLGTIDGRSTKYGVTFKVRVAKGTKARKLTFKVSGGGAHADRNFTVGVAPKPRKYKSLSGRYFWGYASTSLSDSSGWDTNVMWFLNKKWVYIGEVRNAAVPKCRRTTKQCRKYTYNRKTGVAKVAGQKFRVTTYGFGFKVPGEPRRAFEPVTFPRKGARLGANLVNQDWSGHCVLMCTATTTFLTLDRKGRFVRSGYSVGSWPGMGSSWSSVPPDKRGRYRLIGKGRIEFRFANGKVERKRIAISHNALNRPSTTTGLVLGAKPFYFQ